MRRILATAAACLFAIALGPVVARADATSGSYNGLALTPPMGFNDWNAYGCNVSASLIEQTALAMHDNGMLDDHQGRKHRSAITGGVVRIGTAAAGDLEGAVVTAVGTAGAGGTGITPDRPLKMNHPSGEQTNKDGMTLTEERSELTLWAQEAAPLIAGTNVADMAPQDLAIYANPGVVAVDQDASGDGRVGLRVAMGAG